MGWKTLGVVAVAVLSAAASTTTAAAATPHWQVSELPMPAGQGTSSTLWAHDGHGGYTAIMGGPQGSQIVTWKDGKPTEHGQPAGKQLVRVWGESRDDTLLVGTYDNKLFTMDATGFHAVPTGQFTFVEWAAVGPRGDILIMADAADGSSSVQHSTVADPGAWQPLAGATPGSEPIAVDDDGTALINDPVGSYVLRDGVVQRLSAPAPFSPDVSSIKHGVVVGAGLTNVQGDEEALKWAAPGYAPQVLDSRAGANDVNSHGLIVGVSGALPVVWQHDAPATDLPLPTGMSSGVARFVDDDGTVVGSAWMSDGSDHTVIWRR